MTNDISRRSILARATAGAALSALLSGKSLAAVALSEDPVYAAIKRERDAFAAYCVTAEIQSRISDQDPFPPGKPFDHKANARRRARPEWKAYWAEYEKAEAAHEESAQTLWSAREAFLQTRPTTVAGLFAFLDHMEGPLSSGEAGEAFWDEHERDLAIPTLAASIRDLIA
jgi:hypothetical protein